MKKFETYLPGPAGRPFETVARLVAAALGTEAWPVVAPLDGEVGVSRVWLADDACLIQARRGDQGIQAIVRPTAYGSFDVAVAVLALDILPDGPDDWAAAPASDWLVGMLGKALGASSEVSEVGLADSFARSLAVKVRGCDSDGEEAGS